MPCHRANAYTRTGIPRPSQRAFLTDALRGTMQCSCMATTLTPRPVVQSAPPGTNSGERSTDLIVAFANARRSDVPKLGGKGANLGEMTAAGLPVPPGFILAIEAYRQFYESNELGPRIAALIKNIDPDDPAALERSASALRQLIVTGTVPDSLRGAIESAYDGLTKDKTSCRRVAVRSSATRLHDVLSFVN